MDERRVALAALLEAARARRRWVKLGEADYVLLSQRLMEKLAPLAHLAEQGQLPQLTLGTVPLLEALSSQVEALEAAEEWKRLTQRLLNARDVRPRVPRQLKATLRDYQVEGLCWLARLAE